MAAGPEASGESGSNMPAARMRKWALKGALVVVGLLAAELVLRVALPPHGLVVNPWPIPPGLIVPHPVRGYAYASGFKAVVTNALGVRLEISINEYGFRNGPISPQKTACHVLCLGDSFTVGFGLNAHEAWPAQLGRRLNALPGGHFEVINAGISGYSLRQIRQLAEEVVDELEPDIMVLGLYASRYFRINNPYEYSSRVLVSRESVPRLREIGGRLFVSHYRQPWARCLDFWCDRYCYVGAYLAEALATSKRQLRLTLVDRRGALLAERAEAGDEHDGRESVEDRLRPLFEELEKLRTLAERTGVALLVVPVNHQEADGSFSEDECRYTRSVLQYCRLRGIPYVDVLSALIQEAAGRPKFRLPGDHHWSAAAHALAAEAIATHPVWRQFTRTTGSGDER